MRPDEDDVWLDVATCVARRSICVVRQAGCVIVSPDGRVVSSGYNGLPAGFFVPSSNCQPFCPKPNGNPGPCPMVHAEANALLYADRDRRLGGTAYITSAPCFNCAKLLANSGLDRVVFIRAEVDRERTDMDDITAYLTRSDVRVVVRRRARVRVS